jgi:APA family basic amino acid/polyamine antiporter
LRHTIRYTSLNRVQTKSVPPENVPLPSQAKGQLLRILGVGFGIAVIVGDTIATGILRTPGEVAGYLGNRGLIIGIWILGALFAFFSTLAVIELGTTLPFAGGWYVYSRRAMGDFAGFVVGCSDWVVQTATTAYLAVAFGEFAVEFQPAFRGQVKLLAVAVLLTLTFLNWFGLRMGSRMQEAASLAKAVALLAFVFACYGAGPGVASAAAAPAQIAYPKSGMLLAFVLAIQAVIVTYDGWYAAIYFTEENKNPAKNLPRSSLGGVLACATIFLLVNGALFHVLPMRQLAHSQMPVADAAMAILGSRGKQLILLISLLAAVSTINATILMTPRILFAMARDRLLPQWLASVNARGTPTPALLIGTLLAMALALSGSFETLIAICSILFAAVYLSGFVSLFVLRKREPKLPRPFRIWGYPWSNLGVLLASVAFLTVAIVADLRDALFMLVLIALTVITYFLLVRRFRSQQGHIEQVEAAPRSSGGERVRRMNSSAPR